MMATNSIYHNIVIEDQESAERLIEALEEAEKIALKTRTGNWLQRLCDRLTNHRWRKLLCWSEGIEPQEFHWRCRICGHRFWNYRGRVK